MEKQQIQKLPAVVSKRGVDDGNKNWEQIREGVS